jgi:hypothetical protein
MPDESVTPEAAILAALLWSYRDVRRALHCSQSTVEMLVRENLLKSVQIGAPGSRKPRRMFEPAEVERFIAERAAASTPGRPAGAVKTTKRAPTRRAS